MSGTSSTHAHFWAAILAGGDGTRLQSFTEPLCGDRRPKQFCRLLSSQTLLASTRIRLCRTVAPQQTLCVVTRCHEPYYRDEFAGTAAHLIVEQPLNRGTGVAIVYALARLARFDPHGVVGVFPSDHHYENELAFQQAASTAYALASCDRSRIVLLGARPDRAETEYGWIARGMPVSIPAAQTHDVHVVAGFHEKPDRAFAAELLGRGALWNTFIMVGHVSAFIQLFSSAMPLLRSTFEWLRRASAPSDERAEADALYDTLPSVDFSTDVLSHDPARLTVLTLPASGWTDLGQASRIRAVLAGRRDRQTGLAAS